MKKIYLPLKAIGILVLVVMMGIRSEGANRYSVATGNWGSTSTWSATSGGTGGASVPGAADAVIIEGGFAINATAANVACASLTITAGTLSLLTRRLTVSGAINNAGTITLSTGRIDNSAGTSNITNTGTITGSNITGTIRIGGNFINSGTNSLGAVEVRFYNTGATTCDGFTTTGPFSNRKTGGSVTFLGNVNCNGISFNDINSTTNLGTGLTHTSTGVVSITSTNTLNGGSSTLNINMTGTGFTNTGTFTAASGTINYGFAGTQTCLVTTYNNLTLSGTSAKTFATTPTVNGVLSLEGTASVLVTTGVITYGANATLQYNKPAAYTATAEEWISPFTAAGGIIIKNTGAITTPGSVQIGNNTNNVPLNINSGATLTPGANLLTFYGDFIKAGTLTDGSGGVTITGSITTQSIAGFITTGTVSMTKTAGTATFTGNIEGSAFILSGLGGTLNLGAGLTHSFSGTFTRTNGTLNFSSCTLNINGLTSGTGGILNTGTSTVNYGRADIQTVFPVTYYNLILSGSGTKTVTNVSTITNNLTLSGTASATAATTMTIGGDVILESGTFNGGTFTINAGGNWTNNGGTFTPATSTINFNNTSAGKAINGTAVLQTFNNLSLNNSNQTLTAGSDLTIATLTSSATSTLDMGTNTLTIVTATANAGKIYTQNTSGTPITSGKTWGGTLIYNGASAQTAMAGIYTNLTISTIGGVTASGNITVNGELNLAAANASATKGCFETTANYALTMGGSSLTFGTGDVTGVVTRTSFVAGTPYTFGNQFTTLNLSSIGTLASLSMKIVLAVVPWTPTTNTVKRYYEIIQSGGSAATIVTMDLHYLDSELNGASEDSLVFWDYHNLTTFLHEHTRSSYNSTDNWVEMTNLTLTYIAPASAFGAVNSKYYSLADWTTSIDRSIWFGESSGVWDLADNWTGRVPTATSNVIIPDANATDNDPILPASLTLNSLTIQSAGILDGGSTTVTLTGAAGAWLNQGTFNSESSTLIFNNAAATMADVPPPIVTYNNITVATGAKLTIENGSHIGIKGALTLEGTAILDAATNECTVEYNGIAAQTVINPNGSIPGYHNLILNNTASLNWIAGKLYIRGDWTNNMSGITASNVEFNGPYSMVQNIKGTQATTFTTLTINNSTGIALSNVDLKVNFSLVLTSGVITTGNNTVIINSGGSVTRTTGWVNGNLQKTAKIGTNQFNNFEVGGSVYALAQIYMTVPTGNTVVLTTKVTNGNPASGSGIIQAAKCNHYWTISKSGTGSFSSCYVKLSLANTTNTGTIGSYKARRHEGSWSAPSSTYASNIVTVGVNPDYLSSFGDFEIGEIETISVSTQPSNTTICNNSSTSFTAASNSIPVPSVQWYRTNALGTVEAITSALDQNSYTGFQSGTLMISQATTTLSGFSYKAVFTNINGSVTSDAAFLTVNQTSVGGSISGGTTVCYGVNSTPLNLLNNIGLVTEWQYSTDDGINYTAITNTGSSYTANNIIVNTMYRALIQSGVCSSAYSSPATIIAGPNEWTGAASDFDWSNPLNWCGGIIPDATTNVTIPSDAVVNVTAASECKDLYITPNFGYGTILTINAGKSLTVNGVLTNDEGTTGLIIKSDGNGTGSLLNSTGSVSATVERYIPNDFKWHFLSSPVSSQEIWPAFAPAPVDLSWGAYNAGSPYNWDFYYFNPNASTTNELYWVNLRKDETGAYNSGAVELPGSNAGFGEAIPKFDVGRGYLVAYNTGSTTHLFDGGYLNAGDITQGVTYGSNPNNLVGNPYPSSIDWTSESWSRTNLATATGGGYDCWIWNDNLSTGNYGVCNSFTGTGTNFVTKDIAPGQAFFVKAASSGSLGMSDAIRVHSTQPFLKNTNAETNLVRLKIENTANTYSDEMIVEFNADFSGGGSDKFWSFYTVAPEIYSVKDGNNYSIDRYNTLTDDMKVDIAAKTGVAATYTITATNIDDFTLRDKVYLLDMKTGVKTNLKQTPSYSFAGTPDDDRNRFQLIFGTSIGTDEETASDFTIYASDNIIYIRNDKANEPYTVMVSNMLGQIITRTQLAGNTLNQIELKRVPGVYVVTVYSEGKLYSRKVVVK